MDALKKFMVQWKEAKCAAEKTEKVEVITVAGLLEQLGRKAAGINLLEVERYLKESKVGIDYTFMLQVLDVLSVFYDRLLARYLAMQTNRLRGMQVGSFSALFRSSNLEKKKKQRSNNLDKLAKDRFHLCML